MTHTVVLQRSEKARKLSSASVTGPRSWRFQWQTEGKALENVRSTIQGYLAIVAEQSQGAAVREQGLGVLPTPSGFSASRRCEHEQVGSGLFANARIEIQKVVAPSSFTATIQ